MEKIAVLFSGQGAQYPGMMKDLYDEFDASQRVYKTASEALSRDIISLTFNGRQEDLNLTHNTQPCVLAADLAAYETLLFHGIKADAVAGFSLGEYGALVAAGTIKLDDVFQIIQKRADYMQDAVPVGIGGMAAIGGESLDEVRELCESVDGYVVPANINCPGQIVISGLKDAVQSVVDLAIEKKMKAMVLPVSAPFHCDLLEPAAQRLASELDRIVFCDPSISVFMNFDGESESSANRIKEKLVLQAKSPVYWELTLRNMYDFGVRHFIECGPGKTLSGFVKKTFKGQDDISIHRVSDIETMKDTVDFFMGR